METLGLAAAEDVVSPIDLPSFDNSAMDGYAVRQADVATASEESPVHLPVVGEIGAGQARLLALSPGTAAKIMTGAPVPAGADCVVPYEWTDRGVAQVRITQAGRARASTSAPAGEDVSRGRPAGRGGHRARPAPPRAAGQRRPRHGPVAAATAGGDPLDRLRAARARHRARPRLDLRRQLLAARRRRPAAPARSPTASASCPTSRGPSSTRCSDQLVRADLVVTSGGVSQGDFDVVKEALAPLGTVWFGPVAMQPGKPQGFGVVGEDRIPIFTLPGNPVSSYISFEMFVLPALRKLMGKAPYVAPDDPGPAHPRRRLARGPAAVPARLVRARPRRPHGLPGRRRRVPPGRRPRRLERPHRRTRGHHRAAGRRDGPGARPRRGVLMATEDPAELTHVDDAGAARMVDVSAKDVTARVGGGDRPGARVSAGWSSCCAARACRRATRSRSRGSPGSWAPSRPPP